LGQELLTDDTSFPQQVWYWLKNLVLWIRDYTLLSPNRQVRWRVNRRLRHRPPRLLGEWCADCQRYGIPAEIARFAYHHLPRYSGLNFEQVQLDDRLETDLQWTEVCWFDWELKLCNDVWQAFRVNLIPALDALMPNTVGDLLIFLTQHLEQTTNSGSQA
jgi:hypothetical protein